MADPPVRSPILRVHSGPIEIERCKMIPPKLKSFCHQSPTYLPTYTHSYLFPCLVQPINSISINHAAMTLPPVPTNHAPATTPPPPSQSTPSLLPSSSPKRRRRSPRSPRHRHRHRPVRAAHPNKRRLHGGGRHQRRPQRAVRARAWTPSAEPGISCS